MMCESIVSTHSLLTSVTSSSRARYNERAPPATPTAHATQPVPETVMNKDAMGIKGSIPRQASPSGKVAPPRTPLTKIHRPLKAIITAQSSGERQLPLVSSAAMGVTPKKQQTR